MLQVLFLMFQYWRWSWCWHQFYGGVNRRMLRKKKFSSIVHLVLITMFMVFLYLKWQDMELFLKLCIKFCILFGNYFSEFCILFGIIIIKTSKLFSDCSGKVSLGQIRRGQSRKYGGFNGGGSVLRGTGACVLLM